MGNQGIFEVHMDYDVTTDTDNIALNVTATASTTSTEDTTINNQNQVTVILRTVKPPVSNVVTVSPGESSSFPWWLGLLIALIIAICCCFILR